MRECVLIHAGWSGGWQWEAVVGRLRTAGIVAHAPTLAGLAERAAEPLARDLLNAHVGEIAALLEERDLRDIVLVGHSYGGAVATGVAHRRPGRIAELVYLDGFIPRDGQSIADILGPAFVVQARATAEQAGTPDFLPPIFPPEVSVGWTGERARALAARRSPHPLASLFDPLRAPGTPEGRPSYIYCARPAMGSFDGFAAAARTSPEWRYFELPCPHDAAHAMPAAVAGIIETLATP